MRTCHSCGRENPDDSDFCACGEYLRWEPTSYQPAVSAPAVPASGASEAPTTPHDLDPNVTLAGDAVPPPGRAWGAPAAAGGLGEGARPAPGTPGSGDAPPGAAALALRLPNGDSASQDVVAAPVVPGQQVLILGTIRNQSEVVDNFDMMIRGLPEGWWTITPATAYLVPYGTAGTYEQEIQILIHPPRNPEAQARPWNYEVVAESRAYGGEVASSPASVTVEPYYDIATELRPERGSGRLKARYKLTVRNKANARTEVALAAEDTDAECQFRFAEPSIALEPGNAIECPFTCFPPRQIWLGRVLERRFQVTATPIGVELPVPQPPRQAVFRQKPWLPWWMAIVAPLAIIAAILLISLLPKQAVIPDLKKAKTVFAAQKIAEQAGFKLSPKTTQVADPSKPAGSIADQSPPAGAKAKKGTLITLAVYVGSGSIKVPSIVGLTVGLAQQKLITLGLVLGAVTPKLDPNGKVGAQLPLPDTPAASGSAVAVFLAGAGGAVGAGNGGAAGAQSPAAAAAAKAAAGAAATGVASAAAIKAVQATAGSGKIVIPPLSGDPATAAAKLTELGLAATPVKHLATVPIGQVAGTVPAAGAKVAKGAPVLLLVSSGSPQLSFDNGSAVSVIDPTTGKASANVPAGGAGPQVEASWSPDGTHIIYSQNGQLVIFQPNVKGASPVQLTQPQSGIADHDPSFAPTTKSLTIAFVQRVGPAAKLCFATLGRFALNADCTSAPGWDLGGEVEWSPDGSTILVLATRNGGANFGLMAFNTNVPFSTHAADWGHGTMQTNVSVAGHGVFAGEFSPDGKSMALVSNIGSSDFGLFIVKAGQFNPPSTPPLVGHACQVAWRSDGQELAVMQPAGGCSPTAVGSVVGLDVSNPRVLTTLAPNAAHPSWQPVPTGG